MPATYTQNCCASHLSNDLKVTFVTISYFIINYYIRFESAIFTESNMVDSFKVCRIRISQNHDPEKDLYRLKRGSKLRVHPDTTLLGKYIILFTNYPDKDKNFVRTEYRRLDWKRENGSILTNEKQPYVHIVDTDLFVELELSSSGTYRFWFKFQEGEVSTWNGALYVQVEPTILVGAPGKQKVMSLDTIRCQTFISKLLGPINTWEEKLRIAKESGYNVIHFTPIQELGGSCSAYSLRNQLRVNPHFAATKDKSVNFADIEKILIKCREEWNVASICDIVLNHTANESDWLLDHPEAAYSCYTSPYLRPAFLLDALLAKCGSDIADGLLEQAGIPAIIEDESHVDALKYQLQYIYLPKINLHEFYQCDINKYVDDFTQTIRTLEPPKLIFIETRLKEVQLLKNNHYRRFGANIDFKLATEIFNVFHPECFDEESRIHKCSTLFRQHLENLNDIVRCEINGYLNYAIENCIEGIRYERIKDYGPRIRDISEKHPVFMQYFTNTIVSDKSLQEIEESMYGNKGKLLMAHNGWVMGTDDPLNDFAEQQEGHGNVYLKRELIAWGDSVKLRYGKAPDDSPFLWKHMKEYVEITARIFDGVRLDNCHSTPLHVAEYLLDAARQVNPELYIIAELFTNSDTTDNVFVNRLGITSLIREAQTAWNSHEEGRLVYRYGGTAVGSFMLNPQRYLAPSIAHALFMDHTHDNPSPIEKRSVYDLLPTAALVSMACCATGSNRGYDELVPHHIHVVNEKRQYQEWGKDVTLQTGILSAKRALNLLHERLAREDFDEIFVDQMNTDVVAVTRHSKKSHERVILIANTAFQYPNPSAEPTAVRPLVFEGNLEEIVLEASLCLKSDQPYGRPTAFEKNEVFINGYTEFHLQLKEHISPENSTILKQSFHTGTNSSQIDFINLKPGAIVILRVSLPTVSRESCMTAQKIVESLQQKSGNPYLELNRIVKNLNLVNINRCLFCCNEEERDFGYNGGAYNIPGFGETVYCGLQGFISILEDIAPQNDLSHPLCRNLREGDWMLDYITNRLANHDGTYALSHWLEASFKPLKNLPRFLIPCYFDAILSETYNALIECARTLMPIFISDGHKFEQLLGLATLQFASTCKSANLPPLSQLINAPPSSFVTIAAGLPHFSTGYMRCWGRDTFISLRGTLLLTGRFNEARYIILAFGQCLRHGLIPNLLDNGVKPRYNCRDAVWWWLNSIQQYTSEVPSGKSILKDKVTRMFPNDYNGDDFQERLTQNLYEAMQEALEKHFQGLQFREWNAGEKIDAHMKDEGFNNKIGVNPETGFAYGGNIHNCGTWMDKMGSSEKAGNRGCPSTPRDGSAVEIVGLQMSALRFMQTMSENGDIPYKGVQRIGSSDQLTHWTYSEWANRIKDNFEKHFFVAESETAPFKNKTNIYKDSHGASCSWADYQLRCNFPIAMVVAPELFNPSHAWLALEQIRKHLLGPLGLKTLDPDDWSYRGNYDNSNDSTDCAVAHGANYHQGPEWVWPMGFYLRARLIFAQKCGFLPETITDTWDILKKHLKHLQASHWRGLPELTNEGGSFCRDSCPTQAWSVATIFEVLRDIRGHPDNIWCGSGLE